MVLICNLSYYTGKEHFQWKWLDLESSNSSQSGSSRPVKWGPIQEFHQVSSRDAGIWECSAHGPEGKLGSVQYHLEIAGILCFFNCRNAYFTLNYMDQFPCLCLTRKTRLKTSAQCQDKTDQQKLGENRNVFWYYAFQEVVWEQHSKVTSTLTPFTSCPNSDKQKDGKISHEAQKPQKGTSDPGFEGKPTNWV